MANRYFSTARDEIFPHLPDKITRLLDLGCGTGATVAAIKDLAGQTPFWAGGVELDPSAAASAATVMDRIWAGDAEADAFDQEIEAGSLDVILCLDVLEHLADPWAMVRRLSPLLKPGGRLIVSLPNIRHYKFIVGLLFRGDFHYRDAGLLDRTHLRFFVRQTAIELVTTGGLTLSHCGPSRPFRPMEVRRFLLAASFGGLEPLLTKQYVLVAKQT